ncbi:hypothetical protein BC830DRAFT_1164131 [Chytriomyces sp. MP71]|nr:hypothetical protein BC830DRAFT_1164131 [Chytriomyces sp. MP71]
MEYNNVRGSPSGGSSGGVSNASVNGSSNANGAGVSSGGGNGSGSGNKYIPSFLSQAAHVHHSHSQHPSNANANANNANGNANTSGSAAFFASTLPSLATSKPSSSSSSSSSLYASSFPAVASANSANQSGFSFNTLSASPANPSARLSSTPPLPLAHTAFSFASASVTSNTNGSTGAGGAYASADDYGLDSTSAPTTPGSPRAHALSHAQRILTASGGSGSGAHNSAFALDAPPTGSLFDMAQFGSPAPPTPSFAGSVSNQMHNTWSPLAKSQSSSSNNTPILKNRGASVVPFHFTTTPLLPSTNTTSKASPSTSVRVLGFPPHFADAIASHFKSLAADRLSVSIQHVPGSNYMAVTYPSAEACERALAEDGREFDGGVMISVKSLEAAPKGPSGVAGGLVGAATGTPSSPTEAFSEFSPLYQQQQHQAHLLHHTPHQHGFHPYSRGSPAAGGQVPQQQQYSPLMAAASSAKGSLHLHSAGTASAHSPQRRLGLPGGPIRGGTGVGSPERGGIRRVQSAHASGSVFARAATAGQGGHQQLQQQLQPGSMATGGGVRPASMLSQVLNTMFGW